MENLKAGVSKVDITPPIGTMMGGYRLRNLPSQGIHDTLYAKALVFEQDKQRIAIVTTDLGAVSGSLVKKVRELIKDKTGIKEEAILISASHTHSGPNTFPLIGRRIGKTYIDVLSMRLADVVFWAVSNMQLVRIGVGKGKVRGISFNRRLKTKNGKVRLNWEKIPLEEITYRGPIDEELGVIKVETLRGELLATLINFTLHPAVLGPQNLLFSADWPGYATRLIEKTEGVCIALFTNGAEGDVNHIRNPGEWKGTFEDAQRIGTVVGMEALKILMGISTVSENKIRVKSKKIKIPLRKAPFEGLNQARDIFRKKREQFKKSKSLKLKRELEYIQEALWIMERNQKEEEIELQALAIGNSILVGIPAEYFVEYGLDIKSNSPFKYTFIVGLANGYVGYIPTTESFEEGGYEVEFCSTSRFVPQAGEIIKNEVLKLISELKKKEDR